LNGCAENILIPNQKYAHYYMLLTSTSKTCFYFCFVLYPVSGDGGDGDDRQTEIYEYPEGVQEHKFHKNRDGYQAMRKIYAFEAIHRRTAAGGRG
jgi:hypothetical protein